MFMLLAVLVTLRFKRFASIRVIGQPYALPNGASVRWPAACRLHAPLTYAMLLSSTVNFRFIYGAIFGPFAICIQESQTAGQYTIYSPTRAVWSTTASSGYSGHVKQGGVT